jgi:hypothetical protein
MFSLTKGPESMKPRTMNWNPETVSQNKSFLLLRSSEGYFFTLMKSLANKENWYQKSGAIAVTKLDCVVLKPLELVCEMNLGKSGEAD